MKNFKIESKDGEPLYDNYVNFFTAYGESMVFTPRKAEPDMSGLTIGARMATVRPVCMQVSALFQHISTKQRQIKTIKANLELASCRVSLA